MQRKFVIEFTVDDDDLEDWIDTEAREINEPPDQLDWLPGDLFGSQWSTGDRLMSLTVTRNEEITELGEMYGEPNPTLQQVAEFLRNNVNNGELLASQVLASFGEKAHV